MKTINRLTELRVGDVMSHAVVPISAYQTMADAAALFMKHGISGAPVIDEQGHCVGVLSAADFVVREGATSEASASLSACGKAVVREGPADAWHIEDVFNDPVCAHMSSAVQTVEADTPLVQAGRIMCAEHIHRLPVLDDRRRPLGIVTSLDLVAALVNVVDEAEMSS